MFTGNANTSTILGKLAVKTSFAFMSEGDVKLNGMPVGRTGAKFVTNAEANYQIDPRLGISVNGSYTYSQKNKIAGPQGGLITEPKDSNGDVAIGSVGPTYALSDRLNVGLNYSVLWRRHNYYDFIENQYIPAKLKQSVGGILNYAVSPTSSIGFRSSYFWVNEYTGPTVETGFIDVTCSGTPCTPSHTTTAQASAPPALQYTGWTAVLTGSIQF